MILCIQMRKPHIANVTFEVGIRRYPLKWVASETTLLNQMLLLFIR